jgi:putative heme degradation protein
LTLGLQNIKFAELWIDRKPKQNSSARVLETRKGWGTQTIFYGGKREVVEKR